MGSEALSQKGRGGGRKTGREKERKKKGREDKKKTRDVSSFSFCNPPHRL